MQTTQCAVVSRDATTRLKSFFPRFWTGWTHIGEMNDKLFKISSTLAGETKSLFFTRI